MKEGKLGDKCPACGAPKTSFEPYKDPMSAHRRMILRWQLHPVAVHFPTTLTVAATVFSIAAPFLPAEGQEILVDAIKVIVLFIPLVVVAAFWLGWADGTVRFRKIRQSHILKTKIVYAILLFVTSLGLALVVWLGDFHTPALDAITILLGVLSVVLVFLLGILGTSIVGSAFPG